ncbi:hypothetical protein DAPPUDRAFT_106250 [Daphnia pulex]|uniref:Uncharacterized protein n=1 Tax=Daphnia pulex TaxID=6669 RepID=E9GT25_DAPPU|nr:hypothetical protein DAPPUDRAFT_106250 [Daphnia pulex]|eukprot:EFX77348.1 hypothetical protein DAPPUDRAFT_106250 [Daphnia pulex]
MNSLWEAAKKNAFLTSADCEAKDCLKKCLMCNVLQVFVAEEGMRGLVRGWVPTAIGYSAQGVCKFKSHETFKTVHANALREEDVYVYRSGLYLSKSAPADIVLSQM